MQKTRYLPTFRLGIWTIKFTNFNYMFNIILLFIKPRYGSYPFANHFMRPGITFGFDFMMIDTQNVKYIHDDRLNEIFKVLFREQIALNLNKSDRTHMKRKLTDEQYSSD